ncbi:MAG: hypothetical protein P8Z70_01155 [Desulfuromonadales bacterium]|jgi:rubrerythrin
MKVIDFAIEVERAERDFFRRMSEEVQKKGLKTIYRRMAEEEEVLLRRFEGLKTSGEAQEEAGRLDSLLKAFRERLDARRARGIGNEVETYRYLAEVEKGVCRLFEDAAESERDEGARRRLAQIAGEECRESEEVETLYDFTNAPNEFLAWGEFSNLDEFHNFGRYAGASKILPDPDTLS